MVISDEEDVCKAKDDAVVASEYEIEEMEETCGEDPPADEDSETEEGTDDVGVL